MNETEQFNLIQKVEIVMTLSQREISIMIITNDITSSRKKDRQK
jgi:hypothetical protein